ncbi:MAG: CAAX amino protease family protein [Fusobacteria bacterium]|nr:MAG: CAAX amino protease family protein [Fusobacteriota bacterium]KAF0228807.1 MAG: CAAX amino protease family [Fusobacteriota bacterium]
MKRWMDVIGQTIFYIALYIVVSFLSPFILGLMGIEINIINQIISSSIIFSLIVLITNKDKLNKKGWFTKFSQKELIKTLELAFASIILVNLFLVYLFPNFMDNNMPEVLKEQFESIALSSPLLALLAIGILAPIAEELLFRGAIYNLIKDSIGKYVALFVSSVLFALIHLNIYQASYTLFIGLFLGIILMKIGSLWLPIIFHIVYNLFGGIFGAFDQKLMELLFLKTYIIPVVGIILLIDSLRFFLSKGGRR